MLSYRSIFQLCILVAGLLISGCQPQDVTPVATKEIIITPTEVVREPLVVFAAGSLIIPFNQLEKAFEEKYPEIDVLAEYHGSIQVMRHATELHEPIDVVATADVSLIPMLMYSVENPDNGLPYADWYITFAGNKLALAYTDRSLYADEINESNWQTILANKDIRLGLSDPRFDAAGYRTLMAFALDERTLNQFDIFDDVFGNQFQVPITIFREEDLSSIQIPEILETNDQSNIFVRGSSIQLVSLLETGDIDYAFEYETVIQQHGLNMFELPPEVNLGIEELTDWYSIVQVETDFQRFSTVQPVFKGEPILYGITIPSSAPNPDNAELFIQFLLSEEGQTVMKANNHPLLTEYEANGTDNMPETLRAMFAP